MSANITGKGRVFAKEHEGWTSYTIGISSKTQDGKWVNTYQPIRFRKGESVPNGTDIEYRAFAVVKERTIDGQNRNYVVWQILEYKIVEKEPQEDFTQDFSTQYEPLQEGGIPF